MNRTFQGTILLGSLILAIPLSNLSADAGTDAAAKTYAAKCVSCHAKDGKGNAAMAKVFKVEPAALDLVKDSSLAKSDADLAKLTTDGKDKMPAYKGKLTDSEITGLVAYIRSLAPKK
jgi:cytochrome c6